MSIRKVLIDLLGPQGIQFVAILLSGAGALYIGSCFLSTLCAFIIVMFVGRAGMFYSHASYFVAIEEPSLTIILFSVLAWISYYYSQKLKDKYQRIVEIFSRACVFIVNMAFWIGSLWGDKKGSLSIPDVFFSFVWALALVGVGTWAAMKNKRWIVNTTAVFGSIHFYTQWFGHLGANPGSLVFAGFIALGIIFGLRKYNQTSV